MDNLHQEDERIDYAPVTAGGKTLVVPVRTIINIEAITDGYNNGVAPGYTQMVADRSHLPSKLLLCNTIFVAEYKDYRLASAAPPAQQ
jgi:hypothetical protein